MRKCNYCDFFSASGTEEEQAAYVSAVIQEIQSYQELSGEYEVQTIFLGRRNTVSADSGTDRKDFLLQFTIHFQ